jgi:hypothetical protein
MDFSSEERSRLEGAFTKAFEKLKQSMPSPTTAECETNHFDYGFHKELANGLHLEEILV